MTNKNISDFVAASMDAVLNSDQHKSLFNTQYKFASDENDAKAKKPMCEKCGEKCKCHKSDSQSAWDEDELHVKDSSCAMCGQDEDKCYCWSADDELGDLESSPEMSTSAALDVAIDGLLTASAALDAVGIGDGSTVSLKLASLIVQAKKEMSAADKKKLVARLQKGKKGKKPASTKPASKSTSSSSSSSKSSGSSSSSSSKSSGSSSAKMPAKKK